MSFNPPNMGVLVLVSMYFGYILVETNILETSIASLVQMDWLRLIINF